MAIAAEQQEEPGSRPRGHLFIGGTGRAGTSFLVRYLAEMGLDTQLSRCRPITDWDEAANAGLENIALLESPEELPYVVKSPWLYEIIDEIIERRALRIETVIIPVRQLAEAAMSRSLVELRAIHETAPWMAMLHKTWEGWGYTPGGAVFSLNPLDQARLMAVGFHVLIEKLVAAEIPILFLEFPRLAQDGVYLFNKLRPWLPATISQDQALGAHRRIADPEKIRVGPELRAQRDGCVPLRGPTSPLVEYQGHTLLDHLAMRRELIRLQQAQFDSQAALAAVYASSSWKITRPIRSMMEVARRLMRRRSPATDKTARPPRQADGTAAAVPSPVMPAPRTYG
jgi:hypothetical protein